MQTKRQVFIATLAAAIAIPLFAQGQPAKGPRYRFNAGNVPGWSLMSPAERTEHRNKMLAAKTYDECMAVWDAHRKEMDARANAKGRTLGPPRVNACEQMKARGLVK